MLKVKKKNSLSLLKEVVAAAARVAVAMYAVAVWVVVIITTPVKVNVSPISLMQLGRQT